MIPENCVADLEQQIKYLGPLNMFIYHNQANFVKNDFYERSVETYSTIQNIQMDEYRPNWITSEIMRHYLDDEVAYVQYGESIES